MLQYIVRFGKRLAVLLPGLTVAVVSFYNIYPVLDRRVNGVLAFLLTYILAAYVLIPAITRLVRIFIKPKHLPVYSVTPDGYASDPVNVGIIGTKRQLVGAMHKAGWEVADDHSISSVWREVVSGLFRIPYPTAPMSNLYLLGRKQDIGFEIQIADRWWHRHHVRFWATNYDDDTHMTADSIHWIPRKDKRVGYDDDTPYLWLGAASKDVGLALIKHNAQLTHMIHPDTDAERDLIVDHLTIDGATLRAELTLAKPYRLSNRAWSGYLQTDGTLKVVCLNSTTTTSKA